MFGILSNGEYCCKERNVRKRYKRKARDKGVGLEVIGVDGSYELGESETPYEADLGLENEALWQETTFYWNVSG